MTSRIDIIGQNGNDGLHYEQESSNELDGDNRSHRHDPDHDAGGDDGADAAGHEHHG